MPSVTQSAPLSPFDVESTASVFRRLLLRFAVVAGLASSILVWSPAPLAGCLVFVVAFAMLTTAASLRHQRGAQAARAGLTTARVSVNVVAAVAVVDLAGITGVLLVATCVALADGARAWIARHGRLVVRRLHGERVSR
jgi:hypothetical protein